MNRKACRSLQDPKKKKRVWISPFRIASHLPFPGHRDLCCSGDPATPRWCHNMPPYPGQPTSNILCCVLNINCPQPDCVFEYFFFSPLRGYTKASLSEVAHWGWTLSLLKTRQISHAISATLPSVQCDQPPHPTPTKPFLLWQSLSLQLAEPKIHPYSLKLMLVKWLVTAMRKVCAPVISCSQIKIIISLSD